MAYSTHVVVIHLCSGTMLNPEIFLFKLIHQEKVTDVDCSGCLARAALSIALQQNGRFVVLTQDVLLDIIPLLFHKELGPEDHLCYVIGTHQFRLRAASGVQLLLPLLRMRHH